jgi:hypothetical protein
VRHLSGWSRTLRRLARAFAVAPKTPSQADTSARRGRRRTALRATERKGRRNGAARRGEDHDAHRTVCPCGSDPARVDAASGVLTGAVDAVVEFHGRGFPKAGCVNGQAVPTEHNHHPLRLSVWTFRFELPSAESALRAELKVLAPLGDVRWLQLSIDEATVYEEDDYGRTIAVGAKWIGLPIPASSPAPEPGANLPLPGDGPPGHTPDEPPQGDGRSRPQT